MTDWLQSLLSGFSRAVQSSGANQRTQEQQAEQAMRTGQSTSGVAGVAAALGNVAANASSSNTEKLSDHDFPIKFRQGGCDVFVERGENEAPVRLRVTSLIYVYSDAVAQDVVVRKAAKIATQINNYWNNRIPPTRVLTLTCPVGGTLAFSYAGLPALSIAATGSATIDATALKVQWQSNPQYDAIGNAEVDSTTGDLLVTFIDPAPRAFADSSSGGGSIAELILALNPGDLPIGTYFNAAYEAEFRALGAFATGPGDAPQPERPPVDVVFDFETKPYEFLSPLNAAGRTDEMNRIRDEALKAGRNVLWVHLNDNEDALRMTSWASGGLGSFRVNAWPGEYAHEAGHWMGHWTNANPVNGTFANTGEHSQFNTLMGATANKSFRRVDQVEIDLLNFSRGLGGRPTAFPGTILRERLLNERKTVGHSISAVLPNGTYLRDAVIYLDMSNFDTARPAWNPGD